MKANKEAMGEKNSTGDKHPPYTPSAHTTNTLLTLHSPHTKPTATGADNTIANYQLDQVAERAEPPSQS